MNVYVFKNKKYILKAAVEFLLQGSIVYNY
jgi:hypothetical protein